ncbi:MAG: phosphate/phosphite/phosphonate ABC transporter substrate-binding protein [Halieaceae bacterium]
MSAKPRGILLAALCVVLLSSCSAELPPLQLQTIRVGLLPDQDLESQRLRYVPFLEYLAQQTGHEIVMASVSNYGELVEQFGRGEIDMALFGGYTYLLARERFGARPLVLRDNGHRYRSSFIARSDDLRVSIEEFAGETLVFGSRLSTSGHMMPRYFLSSWGIDPEQVFAEPQYSGSHTATIERVLAGQGAIGVGNAAIINEYLDQQGAAAGIKIIRQTPAYTDYVWAVGAGMPAPLELAIRDAFLALSPVEPRHAAIMAGTYAEGFLPALRADFAQLEAVMSGMRDD